MAIRTPGGIVAIVSIPPVPVAAPAPPRRDAARNRELLLTAARELIAARGVESVSMDDLAVRAGVGKGTVFRRFGSRAGLLHALLDDDEQQLQATFMFGPPPLGPGGPPHQRLVAFGKARIELIARHGDLLMAAEQASADPYDQPPWRVSTMVVQALLNEAGCRGDVQMWTTTLMAGLGARWILHNLGEGISLERIEAGWEALVDRVLD
jgi:AcrR family transcriptional regulator